MKVTILKILSGIAFSVILGLGLTAGYRLWELSQFRPGIETEAKMNEFASSLRARANSAVGSDDACRVSGLPEDEWSQALTFTQTIGCENGGCLYELRSKGPDGVLDSGDDILFTQLIGDCSGHDFSGFELVDVDAEGAKLAHADFSEAILRGVRLRSADLRNASFRGAQFGCVPSHPVIYCVNLRGANLKGVDLSQAHLDRVDFRDANLTSAIVRSARFQEVELSGANLQGVDLSMAEVSP